MIIFPAVDIKGGQCVRLRQGKADESTVFSSNPVRMAELWAAQGSSWLHVVDLDGAFDGKPVNLGVIKSIRTALPKVRIQLGGGIRDLETAGLYLEYGVTRLILGTVALEDPQLFASICQNFPGRIGVSLDAAGGRLKTQGWVSDSGLGVDDVLPRLAAQGAAFIVYTDIERDGMRSGINMEAMTRLAMESPVPVIAAGGVTALADVRALYPLSVKGGLEGAVTGRAIYEGTLKLHEALAWVEAQKKLGNPTLGD